MERRAGRTWNGIVGSDDFNVLAITRRPAVCDMYAVERCVTDAEACEAESHWCHESSDGVSHSQSRVRERERERMTMRDG